MWALVLFSLVFAVVYNFSMWYASRLENVPSFILSFEDRIPFLPWTIIPYLSSGVFFWAVFSRLNAKAALHTFLKRVLLMTVLAGIGFILMPLQYSYPKPEINNPVFGFLFRFLDGVDDPYNQSPSLHVAFAFAFWTVFREISSRWRMVAAVWLILVALSTLTTYQHHLIDIFTGSILAHLVFIIFPSQPRGYGVRNLHVANYFFLAGWCFISAAFILSEFNGVYWLNLLWPALAMFVLGYQYQKENIGDVKGELVRILVRRKIL